MRFSQVYRIVLRKELRELLRDRRSLFWLFAPPIILPGIALCAGLFIGSQLIRIADSGLPITIENPEQAPELVERFENADGIQVVDPSENPDDDPFGEAVLIVAIPEDFQEQLETEDTVNIELVNRDSSIISVFGTGAVRAVINDYSNDLLDERLAEAGLNRDWLNPIEIGEARRVVTDNAVATGDSEDAADGNLLVTIFLPLAVTSWLLGGGMGLILDTTVGEKERQTIENLLVTPASRIGIVMGKMTVVFLASMMVMSLWLTEGLVLNALSSAAPELIDADELSPTETLDIVLNSGGNIFGLIIALLLMIIPFTVMLNGLVMAWCAYAANYREANLFMALIQLGLPASVLLTVFSVPPDISDAVYGVPLFGTIVAIRDLFSQSLTIPGLIINFISGTIYAALATWLAAWVFGREWSLTRGLQ